MFSWNGKHIKNIYILLYLLLLVQNAKATDYIWSPTILTSNSNTTAEWNTQENWTPQGI